MKVGGYNTNIIEKGNGGAGFGLCQWSYGRRNGLENYAKQMNKSPSDLGIQIAYLLAELTPGGGCNGNATYQIISPSSLTYMGKTWTKEQWTNGGNEYDFETPVAAFMATFERPNQTDGKNSLGSRVMAANQAYKLFRGK